MAKFKVGDKVKLKDNITVNETCIRKETLETFKTEPMTISNVYADGSYDVEENHYCYEEDWLEPYEDDWFTTAQKAGKDYEARKFEAFLREVVDGNHPASEKTFNAYGLFADLVEHDETDEDYKMSNEEFEDAIAYLVDYYMNFVPKEDEPALEITLADVEAMFGHKVKIVPDEKEEMPWE
jgi:uncharacterized protein YodC (DUF2158 family)